MKIDQIIREVQKKLGIDVDGKAGPQTWGAIYQAIVKPSSAPRLAFSAPQDEANDAAKR